MANDTERARSKGEQHKRRGTSQRTKTATTSGRPRNGEGSKASKGNVTREDKRNERLAVKS